MALPGDVSEDVLHKFVAWEDDDYRYYRISRSFASTASPEQVAATVTSQCEAAGFGRVLDRDEGLTPSLGDYICEAPAEPRPNVLILFHECELEPCQYLLMWEMSVPR